jgi:hypothetical protein
LHFEKATVGINNEALLACCFSLGGFYVCTTGELFFFFRALPPAIAERRARKQDHIHTNQHFSFSSNKNEPTEAAAATEEATAAAR